MATVNEIIGNMSISVKDDGVREYTRELVVNTTPTAYGPLAIKLMGGVPRIGDYFTGGGDFDGGARCTSVECERDDESLYVWHVTANYSSKYKDEEENEENPLLRPAKYRWGHAAFENITHKDAFGKAYVNTVSDPYDPPPAVPGTLLTLTVTKNVASYSATAMHAYINTVNNDSFAGFAAGYVKCTGIDASDNWENDIYYWEVTYTFEMHPDKWHPLEVLCRGPRHKVVGTNRIILNSSDDGAPTGHIANLDASGFLVAEGSPEHYQSFRPWREMAFSGLGL